jgi:hypothetical protein
VIGRPGWSPVGVGGNAVRNARQPRQRPAGQAAKQAVGGLLAGNDFWIGEMFGSIVEGVEVAGCGGAEPSGRVVLLAVQGGSGLR